MSGKPWWCLPGTGMGMALTTKANGGRATRMPTGSRKRIEQVLEPARIGLCLGETVAGQMQPSAMRERGPQMPQQVAAAAASRRHAQATPGPTLPTPGPTPSAPVASLPLACPPVPRRSLVALRRPLSPASIAAAGLVGLPAAVRRARWQPPCLAPGPTSPYPRSPASAILPCSGQWCGSCRAMHPEACASTSSLGRGHCGPTTTTALQVCLLEDVASKAVTSHFRIANQTCAPERVKVQRFFPACSLRHGASMAAHEQDSFMVHQTWSAMGT
mmetsp:Transcript_117667/g.367939  ORF Transcript_117667/g.367939 Transcript_117667/m.367939 type:complete len:273 (+) Transcript_117667:649-1467(+)